LAKRPKDRLPIRMTEIQRAKFTDLEYEIMQRMTENQPRFAIAKDLGVELIEIDRLVTRPVFEAEYQAQCRTLDRALPKRLDRLSVEALDVVRTIMRDAASPAYRLRAALEILDRSGHVKVEKRIQINADAETIIKHLNQQGVSPAQIVDAEVVPANEETQIE
jgi:hypothetical protein